MEGHFVVTKFLKKNYGTNVELPFNKVVLFPESSTFKRDILPSCKTDTNIYWTHQWWQSMQKFVFEQCKKKKIIIQSEK